jgi:hypothetical protein
MLVADFQLLPALPQRHHHKVDRVWQDHLAPEVGFMRRVEVLTFNDYREGTCVAW